MFDTILANVIAYYTKLINDPDVEITADSDLMDDLCLSSLELLHGLMYLEDTYGIIVPEKCLRRMLTVGDCARGITELVEKHRQ